MSQNKTIWWAVFIFAGLFLLARVSMTGMGTVYVQSVDGQEIAASPANAAIAGTYFSLSRTIGLWVSAVFTLCIFSFLYRDNPFYKFVESVLIGVSAAYWMVIAFWTVVVPNVFGRLAPDVISRWATPGTISNAEMVYWVPLILGVMLLWRLAPKGAWISRWPLAFIIGTTAGFRLIAYLEADFLSQISNTILPLVVLQGEEAKSLDIAASLKNLLIVVGVLSGLAYFFFSVEHKGAMGKVSRVGIWFLMITFGASFGYTVMGRITLLAQRIEFLFDDWLWLIDPGNNRLGL